MSPQLTAPMMISVKAVALRASTGFPPFRKPDGGRFTRPASGSSRSPRLPPANFVAGVSLWRLLVFPRLLALRRDGEAHTFSFCWIHLGQTHLQHPVDVLRRGLLGVHGRRKRNRPVKRPVSPLDPAVSRLVLLGALAHFTAQRERFLRHSDLEILRIHSGDLGADNVVGVRLFDVHRRGTKAGKKLFAAEIPRENPSEDPADVVAHPLQFPNGVPLD